MVAGLHPEPEEPNRDKEHGTSDFNLYTILTEVEGGTPHVCGQYLTLGASTHMED